MNDPKRWASRLFLGAAAMATLGGFAIDGPAMVYDPTRHTKEARRDRPPPSARLSWSQIGAGAIAVSVMVDHFVMRDICAGEGGDAEGHAHLFVDGEKWGALYGPYTVIDGLAPGRHVLRVTLNTAPDHRYWTWNGAPIGDEIAITLR